MLERWPYVCCIKITVKLLPTNRFVSATKNSMRYVVNWIPLRICAWLRNTQPHLNESWQINKSSKIRDGRFQILIYQLASVFFMTHQMKSKVRCFQIFMYLSTIIRTYVSQSRVQQSTSIFFGHIYWSASQEAPERSARALNNAAASVRQAIGIYCIMQICYNVSISDCRGDWDLGLCTTLMLAKTMQQHTVYIQRKQWFGQNCVESRPCAAALFL